MKITIESTDVLTEIDGVPVRVWAGITERGIPCKLFIHRVLVHRREDANQFEEELQEELPPGRTVDLRHLF